MRSQVLRLIGENVGQGKAPCLAHEAAPLFARNPAGSLIACPNSMPNQAQVGSGELRKR